MKIIIITGTPGCGKTTLSKKLKEVIDCVLISLNELVIEKNFIIEYEEKRETNIIDFEKLNSYILQYIEDAKTKIGCLIIEGHFADFLPNDLIDMVFILRCHPEILAKRLEKRNYKNKKIVENIQAEILGNCSNYIYQKKLSCPIFEIDVTGLSVDNLAKEIFNILEEKVNPNNYILGHIDWLNELFNEDRLSEFFD